MRTRLWENHVSQVCGSRRHRRRRAVLLILRDRIELASSTRISGLLFCLVAQFLPVFKVRHGYIVSSLWG